MNNEYLLLIDGSSLLSTQFYGNLPTQMLFAKTPEEKEKYYYKIMQTSKGVYTNAVYGFLRTLLKLVKEQNPAYLAIAWDLSRNTFRRKIYPDYKGNRSETMQPLKDQFALCQQVLERMGIRQFMDEEYEADDFCGTLAKRFEDTLPVRIITKDRDYLQLVNENTNLWMMHSTAKKTEELYKKYHISATGEVPERCFNLTPELVKAEYGVEPGSIADLKGIEGDPSDNIKGVPGVGETTAVALIARYKSIEALYAEIDGRSDKELKELAASWKEIGIARSPIAALTKTGDGPVGREAAFLSKELATIKCDVPIGDVKLENLRLNINSKEAAKIFEELEFKSLNANDFVNDVKDEKPAEYTCITDMTEVESACRIFSSGEAIAATPVLEGEDILGVILMPGEGSGLYIKAEGFVTPGLIADTLQELDRRGVRLMIEDIKGFIKAFDIKRFEKAFDVSLAEYLCDPLKGSYKTQMRGEDAAAAAAQTAVVTVHRGTELEERLQDMKMTELYNNIELPLCYVLADMERNGILVEKQSLTDFSAMLEKDIALVEKKIYERAGEEFNINSPKQLGVILFEKIKLPFGKKTKSGYSTSAEVLEKLKLEDPIVEDVLEYRKLSKLKSTYADGLVDYIDSDGRIRTTFNQMVTATGRLSSTDPNLQNIPIRTELGKSLRKVFVADKGKCFIDADYSQIELRLLAAMSGDEKLIAAYANSEDIHRATAAAVFGLPYEEVTKEIRARAKAVNFGIVYGISSFGLGNDLGISRKEAEKYISDYFMTYPTIKTYLDKLVDSASADGYAVTYFGRRRPIPELTSANHMQRQLGERMAMNSPIQGTAADVIKLAMIRVYNRLCRELPEAKLVLQVHDELLIEAPVECREQAERILMEEMTGAVELPVKLEAEVTSGDNWLEAH